jgi:hypothetical protein
MRPTPSIAIALVFAVFGGFGASVWAQGKNPLDAIQGTLNALVESVSAIGEHVEPGNVLVTSVVTVSEAQFAQCSVINTSGSSRDVVVEVVAPNGASTATFPFSIPVGQVFGLVVSAPDTFYCKFTVSTGTVKDVRASVNLLDASTLGTLLVVDAR